MRYHKIYMVMSQDKDILISLDTNMLTLEKRKDYYTGDKIEWQFRVRTPYYGCGDTHLASYSSEEKAHEVMNQLINYCECRDAEFTEFSSVFEFPPDGDSQ